jgi:hypothetical protein
MDLRIAFNDAGMAEMKAFITEFPQRVDSAVSRAANMALEWIIRDTPFRKGDASRSWEKNSRGEMSYAVESVIGHGAEYTPFLEEGTFLFGPFGVAPKTYGKDKRIKGGMVAYHMIGKNEPAIEDELNFQMHKEFDKVTNGK